MAKITQVLQKAGSSDTLFRLLLLWIGLTSGAGSSGIIVHWDRIVSWTTVLLDLPVAAAAAEDIILVVDGVNPSTVAAAIAAISNTDGAREYIVHRCGVVAAIMNVVVTADVATYASCS